MTDGYEKLELYIDGEWTQGTGGSEEVINPANEDVIGLLPHASTADLDRALAAAERGLAVWRRSTPDERSALLLRVAAMVRAEAPHIARITTLEQGKPLREAMDEITGIAGELEWMAGEALRVFGRVLPPTSEGLVREVRHEPIGVVLGLSPWNFPATLPAVTIAHALAAGCSIIVKPAEETPGSLIAVARLFEAAGLPRGVLNVVFGVPSEISTYLIASPIIRKVAFTGSVPVGREIYKLASAGMKRVTLELGGHAPVIVFDDVDVDQVVRITASSKFANAGQVCVSPARFYVHDAIADRFIDRFTEFARGLKVDNGLAAGVQMGPMANARRIAAMEEMMADAEARGATVHTGGKRIGNRGFFFEPTVLSNVSEEARMMNVEPFGPIAPINRWNSFDDVARLANRLPYGLTAYAFTQSQARADQVSEALEAGMVGLNTMSVAGSMVPFGGVKDSGVGRRGGTEGLYEYLSTKTVSHRR